MIQSAQKTVEGRRVQFIDTKVEDLAVMQRQDSTIQGAQHHVQNIHEEVEVPVFMRREPLRTLMVRATPKSATKIQMN